MRKEDLSVQQNPCPILPDIIRGNNLMYRLKRQKNKIGVIVEKKRNIRLAKK